MRKDFFKGLVLGSVVASIIALAGAAVAGTGVGAVFNLGVTNTVGKTTTLVGSSSRMLQVTNKSGSSSAFAIGATSRGAGAPALRATNAAGGPASGLSVKPGAAPFTVNSSTMVAKLNAALLDGNSASDFQRAYTTTVVVSPGATPTDSGTALLNALAGITTASSTDPFLVKLEPGVYDVGSTAASMQPYVDIEGSGQDTTTITGTQSSQTLHPRENSELRDVTVENTGGGAAILANISSPLLTHVNAISSTNDGTQTIYGIENVNCSPIMTDVTATASTTATTGSGSRYGVYDSNSSPTMIDVVAAATGGSGSGADYGVGNVAGSAPVMDLVQASASGAGSDFGVENVASSPLMAFDTATATASGTPSLQAGVYNTAGASPMMNDMVAAASGGTYINIGVWNEVSSVTLDQVTAVASGGGSNNRGVEDSAGGGSYTVRINNSEITGSSATIENTSPAFTTDIGGSLLNGGAVSTGGGIVACVDSYSAATWRSMAPARDRNGTGVSEAHVDLDSGGEDAVRYDRAFLIGAKRNDILDLHEVVRYGEDSFRDPDYVSIYGLPPRAWYARGIRLLGRTAVECTRDPLGDLIGRDIAELAHTTPGTAPLVVDPFAGSANTLYWIRRHLPGSRCVGFELDGAVFAATQRNLSILHLDLELQHIDYEAGVRALAVREGELLIAFVAPPWGDALSEASGLDLSRTTPPVAEIVELIASSFPRQRLLFAIQIYERAAEASRVDLTGQFDWSSSTVHGIDRPGRNHGLALGTIRWIPGAEPRRAHPR